MECWRSTDGGETWEYHGTPAPHEPGTNRMNVASGLAGDNSLVVLASGWSNRNPVGQPSSAQEGKILPIWICRSNDSGKSWVRTELASPPSRGNIERIPFGDIVRLADGTLGVCIYEVSGSERKERRSAFYVSADDGRSWEFAGVIHGDGGNETAVICLPDGRLLAAVRTTKERRCRVECLVLCSSGDNGRTWEEGAAVTQSGQIPGHLLLLADGRLLLGYGVRVKEWGYLGIGTKVSSDGGASWSKASFLVRNSHDEWNGWPAHDGGYPSTVQLADGKLVTASYTAGTPRHNRYHMAVSIWTPENL